MSYILDALRKSETERRQGRVPDLGQQVQLIHKPRKKSSVLVVWVGAGLLLNAAVFAYLFWPESSPVVEKTALEPELLDEPEESVGAVEPVEPVKPAEPEAISEARQEPEASAEPEPVSEQTAEERPTIIVPSRNSQSGPVESSVGSTATVPHLVEMPLAFQKSIPDLVFNSHIYASEPSSRRVMINNNYLKPGDTFAGIRVERITEEGVVLSKNGRAFRVGIVRDWVSPD
ncbi:general secretion pathway protein GspB [Marinobacter confluentis]|uniref:Type II secretion system protein GspB C-terminal domain-containing protein n=1 Tax=Marinobacter confluentis TaxID=1697557 RepID=A0A4Z1BFQ2_9GAMM|nr:general secretion pathway protein GspB [Marinobacter confluentis]TGN41564.1 hypothetical protein E5Q11_03255 [Marinobacter confluentis]